MKVTGETGEVLRQCRKCLAYYYPKYTLIHAHVCSPMVRALYESRKKVKRKKILSLLVRETL